MTYIEFNGVRYPATVNGKTVDRDWDGRHSKTITLEMSYADALATFVDGLAWCIVMQDEPYTETTEVVDEAGEVEVIETVVTPDPEYFDNSDFRVAGDIIDHRNGFVSVKMGKQTEVETMRAQLANAVTEDELTAAYVEGVNSL